MNPYKSALHQAPLTVFLVMSTSGCRFSPVSLSALPEFSQWQPHVLSPHNTALARRLSLRRSPVYIRPYQRFFLFFPIADHQLCNPQPQLRYPHPTTFFQIPHPAIMPGVGDRSLFFFFFGFLAFRAFLLWYPQVPQQSPPTIVHHHHSPSRLLVALATVGFLTLFFLFIDVVVWAISGADTREPFNDDGNRALRLILQRLGVNAPANGEKADETGAGSDDEFNGSRTVVEYVDKPRFRLVVCGARPAPNDIVVTGCNIAQRIATLAPRRPVINGWRVLPCMRVIRYFGPVPPTRHDDGVWLPSMEQLHDLRRKTTFVMSTVIPTVMSYLLGHELVLPQDFFLRCKLAPIQYNDAAAEPRRAESCGS